MEEERNEEDEDVGTERLVQEVEEEDVGTDKLVHEEEEELEEDCEEDGEDGEDVGTDKLVHEEEEDEEEELEEEDGKEDEEDGCTDKLVEGDEEEQEGDGEEEDKEEDLEVHDDDDDDTVTDRAQLEEVRMLEDELELAVAVKVRLTIGVLFRGSWISTALLVTSLESESNVRSRSNLIISDPNVQMLNIHANKTPSDVLPTLDMNCMFCWSSPSCSAVAAGRVLSRRVRQLRSRSVMSEYELVREMVTSHSTTVPATCW